MADPEEVKRQQRITDRVAFLVQEGIPKATAKRLAIEHLKHEDDHEHEDTEEPVIE